MTKNNKIAFGILAGSLVGISLFAGGCGTQIAPPPSNVALVDHQVVVEYHPQMKSAQDDMKAEYDKIQNQVKDLEALPPEQHQQKIMEFQRSLTEMETAKLVPIQKAADAAVEDVRKDKNYSVVLDKRVAVAGGVDVTKDVLMKEGLSAEDADKAIADAAKQSDGK